MYQTLLYDLPILQNADFKIDLFLSSNGVTGINLTGYEFFAEIKSSTDPDSAVLESFVMTILDQTTFTGQVQMFLGYEAANGLPVTVSSNESDCRATTQYPYDILMIDSVGFRTRLMQGNCIVSPYVTTEDA